MHIRFLLLLGASALALPVAAGAALQAGAPAPTASATDLATAFTTARHQDPPPKDDEKKNEVTVWVLDASGKG